MLNIGRQARLAFTGSGTMHSVNLTLSEAEYINRNHIGGNLVHYAGIPAFAVVF